MDNIKILKIIFSLVVVSFVAYATFPLAGHYCVVWAALSAGIMWMILFDTGDDDHPSRGRGAHSSHGSRRH